MSWRVVLKALMCGMKHMEVKDCTSIASSLTTVSFLVANNCIMTSRLNQRALSREQQREKKDNDIVAFTIVVSVPSYGNRKVKRERSFITDVSSQ